MRFLKILNFYHTTLLNLFIGSWNSLVNSLGLFVCDIRLYANKDSFTSSFTICILLVSFSWLLARTSNMMLKRMVRGTPLRVLDLSGNALNLLPLSMILAVVFFLDLWRISFYSLFAENFYHEWVMDFIKCFFCFYWYDHVIFLF